MYKDLALRYDFTRQRPTTIVDTSSYTNNGVVSEPQYASGIVGQSYLCEDEGDQIQTPRQDVLHTDERAYSGFVYVEQFPRQNPAKIFGITDELWLRAMPYGDVQLVIEMESTGRHVLEFGDKTGFGFDFGNSFGETNNDNEFGTDRWHHVTIQYDGEFIGLYIDGDRFIKKQLGDTIVSSGNDFTVSADFKTINRIGGAFRGRVDDIRVYQRGLTDDEVISLNSVREFGFEGELKEIWERPWMPLFDGAPNKRLLSALTENAAYVRAQTEQITAAKHIDTASGTSLDRIGRLVGVKRRVGERDDPYRKRIIGFAAAGRSRGTAADIIRIVSSLFDLDRNEIDIQRNTGGQVTITVPSSVQDTTLLSVDDIEDILEAIIPVSHTVSIELFADDAFTLIGDGQINDPELGLTGDDTNVGGVLVGDFS